MPKKILLTSFQTWLPHQVSNASDDLLLQLNPQKLPELELIYLRQLPVDISQSSQQAIAKIQECNPDGILLCGMAESRQRLSLESQARKSDHFLQTRVDLEAILPLLSFTDISHDAGRFVCEGLYYEILHYLTSISASIPCLFVHVPILTVVNTPLIMQDFVTLVETLHCNVSTSPETITNRGNNDQSFLSTSPEIITNRGNNDQSLVKTKTLPSLPRLMRKSSSK